MMLSLVAESRLTCPPPGKKVPSVICYAIIPDGNRTGPGLKADLSTRTTRQCIQGEVLEIDVKWIVGVVEVAGWVVDDVRVHSQACSFTGCVGKIQVLVKQEAKLDQA